MKIGIIGAMDEEVSILKAKLNNMETTIIAGCEFYQGELNGKQVILTKSGIGKVAAAVATTLLLERFNPGQVINTGSAGGYDTTLNVGDIVISTEVRFHDVDLTAFGYEIGQMAQLPAAFPADKNLIFAAQKAAETITHLKTIQGLICTGDIFMADPTKAEIARHNFPTMAACEMEAAAIAQVCYQFKVPFVIIRSLSDIAGKKSELSFEQYLPIAAKNASILVEEIINNLN
ncbi:methylthioadenosine nucleosidase [Psychromonas ingrahamii 37]|uniref:5'-methylthioadenosine/S-adenosylhomocysteine nucleosidase n=1 Tax=Psychromonas ingrahamii (strain DSM 17664 / CCUG 51855 / 37) TaxID=357804 RepID=MTNN_PSYIN|nr:5'-methylthioadenosine/S-adenosylhomocysteine nucleosidase [Psychromonas ingrahamii]A1STE7.1 RecName: Full=5'-methylthioadenosine/S-adenosylhomocysteine nucleosidase; Short=MTA/SAH nucleosidase; Short=MTAN; AltName: Full=5'-deoxyadenosine nucleosidase; Short=DOA nucleosidase; Short=dAdo nucleosidase; AltName: Full=5'-methylthioadenosine nucleosidase; Short=MTA nucleosidase; AltName: Full=S-adenosylhomocysteine nucleosidase; Short=AdoHcy nucleosidase; Short=SAH nucleosidase; Short=SRH nucleosida